MKVTVTDGPVGVLPPSLLELPKKLPIRNSWEFNFGKVTDTVTDVSYFELIREVLASKGCLLEKLLITHAEVCMSPDIHR